MEQNCTKKYAAFVLSEFTWGALLALFLQHTRSGRRLARCRTWLAVVIGVAGVGAISAVILPLVTVVKVALAFLLSGIPIVIRSLTNEQRLEKVLFDATEQTASLGSLVADRCSSDVSGST